MIDSRLLPLAIIEANDEAVEGITRLQKLVFKAQEEVIDSKEYEFEPHDYGPFSKELYNDVDNLVDDGYVDCEIEETPSGNRKKTYSINRDGRKILERFADRQLQRHLEGIEDLKQRDNDKPLLELLSEIYNEHPDMAEESKLDIV